MGNGGRGIPFLLEKKSQSKTGVFIVGFKEDGFLKELQSFSNLIVLLVDEGEVVVNFGVGGGEFGGLF